MLLERLRVLHDRGLLVGVALRLRLLILIVETRANRMMRVVDLHHEVRDGELQLMHPQPIGLALRRKAEARAEPPGDLAGRLPVLGPQLTQDELLPLVHAVPREGRRGRRRQGVLGRPERRLEVRRWLIVCMCWLVSTHFLGHGSSSVRPWSTLAGSW